MRLDRLEIMRWGALADVSLDLSRGSFGLQVVYGDNEAGKSTTRRAISALLFGVPAQTTDNFRYDYRALAVGGTLRGANGDSFVFRRRKGRKDTVVDASEAPLSEEPLARMLGGVDRATFEQEWSLDHERLREGGLALLRGEGEAGESLLAAGLGGIGIGALANELEAEAREIFGRKKTARVTVLLDAIRERRQARESHAISVASVDKERAERRALTIDGARWEDELARTERELATIDRVLRARPALAEFDRVAAAVSESEAARGTRDPRELGVLARSSAIDALVRDLAVTSERRERRLEAEAQRRGIEERLLTLTVPEADDDALLAQALARATKELGGSDSFLKRTREMRRALEQATHEADVAFDALPRWARGPLGRRGLENAKLPTRSEVESHSEKLAISSRVLDARAAEEKAKRDADERAEAARILALEGVPTEGDVLAARAHRDAGWALVSATLRGKTPPAADVAAFAPEGSLAPAFERAFRAADAAADRLRTSASTAAKLEAAVTEAARSKARFEDAVRARAALETAEEAAKGEWLALWHSLAIQPGSPREMQEWLARAEAVRGLFRAEVKAKEALADFERRAEQATAPLRALLARGSTDAPASLLGDAETRVAMNREARRKRDEATRELEALRAKQAELALVIASLSQRDEAYESMYRECAAALGDEAPLDVVQGVKSLGSFLSGARRKDEAHAALVARLDAARAALALVAPEGLDVLRAEVAEAADVDLVERRSALLELRVTAARNVKEAHLAMGAIDRELARVQGGAEAAEDEAAVQGLIASLGEAAADYLRVSYAASMLREAAESYRQTNQSPIVARASEVLCRLTMGSFERVTVDEEDGGKAVIKGVRRGDELVTIEGMSDGVRDQLFLALRLAALEQQIARREPLPFIVDDILIHLSDARARAALEVLAELARKTQVILFTHHSRVVDLARELDDGEVFVHAIGGERL